VTLPGIDRGLLVMALMHCDEFNHGERERLLRIARESIEYGCEHSKALERGELIELALTDEKLAGMRNSFVTLTKAGELRGCLGSLEARFPLAIDVAANAFKSGFRDPRFPALSVGELDQVIIQIAVLSPQTEIEANTEADLRSALKPHVDGLTIDDGCHHATFLPKVWESLPEPDEFLARLKIKAGMQPDYWSPDIKAYRYHAENFAESDERLHQSFKHFLHATTK
jgi:AmmeMemoRadiSam system protein A